MTSRMEERGQNNGSSILHVDGSSTQYVGGVGVILQSPEGDRLEYAIRLQFQMTNNEAKYKVVL